MVFADLKASVELGYEFGSTELIVNFFELLETCSIYSFDIFRVAMSSQISVLIFPDHYIF